MGARSPRGGAHSEEELLEQWDFLDQLVARQAAMLKAGVQDSEEVDELQPEVTEVAGLRRQLEELQLKLDAAEQARVAAQTAHRRLSDQRDRLHRQLASLTGEAARSRRQVETLEADLRAQLELHQAEMAELTRRQADTEAERLRWERERDQTIEALRVAELEITKLRQGSRRGFWRFRGRP
ncbi:MAG: hypothetical protein WCB85_03475 [Candidatus Dormiibacterota bacterium]